KRAALCARTCQQLIHILAPDAKTASDAGGGQHTAVDPVANRLRGDLKTLGNLRDGEQLVVLCRHYGHSLFPTPQRRLFAQSRRSSPNEGSLSGDRGSLAPARSRRAINEVSSSATSRASASAIRMPPASSAERRAFRATSRLTSSPKATFTGVVPSP